LIKCVTVSFACADEFFSEDGEADHSVDVDNEEQKDSNPEQ